MASLADSEIMSRIYQGEFDPAPLQAAEGVAIGENKAFAYELGGSGAGFAWLLISWSAVVYDHTLSPSQITMTGASFRTANEPPSSVK